jgi:heme A synthase
VTGQLGSNGVVRRSAKALLAGELVRESGSPAWRNTWHVCYEALLMIKMADAAVSGLDNMLGKY